MRIALVASFLFLAACAAEKLSPSPPPGVDFSGRWTLNEADSDDPLHLLQSQNSGPAGAPSGTRGQGGNAGRAGGLGMGPAMPPFNELAEGLRWPAKNVETVQKDATVTIDSAGIREVCRPGLTRPGPGSNERGHHQRPPPDEGPSRDMPARERGEGPPPLCGWDGKTLVVQIRDSEDEMPPYVQRYTVSDDGRRLVEVVDFRGGGSGGFSVSRVWDRRPPDSPTPSAGGDSHR